MHTKLFRKCTILFSASALGLIDFKSIYYDQSGVLKKQPRPWYVGAHQFKEPTYFNQN